MEEKFLEMDLLEDTLLPYGFLLKDGKYVLKKAINNTLYVLICLTKDHLEVSVRNNIDDELYLPYKMKKATGAYVSKVREKVDEILESIYKNCFTKRDDKNEVLSYCQETYGTIPEYLWDKTPDACVLRVGTKWYGIMMTIGKDKLGLSSQNSCTILNLKNSSDKIVSLIDNIHYFKAYHMNKKYWFTILLDKTVKMEEVKELIDESYQLIEKKKE